MPKTVILGVSGGIAAYKAAYLTSLLKRKGYDINVILTKNALEFITPLTFETLSDNAAITDTFERSGSFDVKHVSLAKKRTCLLLRLRPRTLSGKPHRV